MNSKLLSIIIPAYNAEKYISDCLDSILKLKIQDVEIIVINDGSTDCTKDIVNKYITIDSRIKQLIVSNGGVSKARNIGIENAVGKNLMFLDADDYFEDACFDLLLDVLQNKSYDFTAFARTILETNNNAYDQLFLFEGAENGNKDDIDFIMYADSLFNECWGKIYKKSIIEKYNIRFPSNVRIGEDVMFVMEYYSHCENCYVYNKPLIVYRQHENSAMQSLNIKNRMEYTEAIYNYSQKYIPDKMKKMSLYYNYKVLEKICMEFSRNKISFKNIIYVYNSSMAKEVRKKLPKDFFSKFSIYKYIIFKYNLYILSTLDYYLRANFINAK